jgi:hypothetical protein
MPIPNDSLDTAIIPEAKYGFHVKATLFHSGESIHNKSRKFLNIININSWLYL